jgi:DNA phosphorothioation-dependent restriction protein DptH
MEFLAGTILDYLKEHIHNELAKPDKSKLIYIMPSFPSPVVTRIGDSMTDFADLQTKNICLVFKVSYELGKSWYESDKQIDKQAYKYITQKGWYDSENHLTSIRNLPRDPKDDLLVIILIGTDQVTDKSSLDDFHKVNTSVIWSDLLGRSFRTWLESKLELSRVSYEKETLGQLDDILITLKDRGLADIVQISDFLQEINFSPAQTGKDALHLLLRELRRFNLPFMRKIPFDKGRNFKDYVDDALSFFSYSDYIDNTKRNKALETIKKYREKFQDSIEDSIEQDDRTGYVTVNEFLDELYEYIESNDNEIRNRLYKTNFVVIRDKILGFRAKNGKDPKKETVKKLSGNPVEVVLHALWLTLADFKEEAHDQGISA